MLDIDSMLSIEPYGLDKEEKGKLLSTMLLSLSIKHYENCYEYRQIINSLGVSLREIKDYKDLPMLPVRLFKSHELMSVSRLEIKKIMTSSGTSSSEVSKIFLDAENAKNQTRVLTHIISSIIGKKRLPLLILDTSMIKKDRTMFSARGAGIVGFTMFGREPLYTLDDNMNLALDSIVELIEKQKDEPILLFGYTFMMWQYILNVLEERNVRLNIKKGYLFHIGGWKKLKAQNISTCDFNKKIKHYIGNVEVFNHYGMVEQLGSTYIECSFGHMHCSNFSDIIIRRSKDFSICPHGEKGLIQLVSVLPTSYPGHVILTEDVGEIIGEDDCPCGRKGKYFKIHGRIKSAEIRGCSDTYEH